MVVQDGFRSREGRDARESRWCDVWRWEFTTFQTAMVRPALNAVDDGWMASLFDENAGEGREVGRQVALAIALKAGNI